MCYRVGFIDQPQYYSDFWSTSECNYLAELKDLRFNLPTSVLYSLSLESLHFPDIC